VSVLKPVPSASDGDRDLSGLQVVVVRWRDSWADLMQPTDEESWRDDYVVTRGSVTIDGDELLGLPTHERAARGLFLALQYPVELPGVRLDDFLDAAARAVPMRPASGRRRGRPPRSSSSSAQAQRRVLRTSRSAETAARRPPAGSCSTRSTAVSTSAPATRSPRRGHDQRRRPGRARDHALRPAARRAAARRRAR
jgi:hypothetical protein